MVSNTHFIGFAGLLLVFFVTFTEQAPTLAPFADDRFALEKRALDAHALSSLPLFRGSNLGIFVRKRPYVFYPEHSVIRRKEARSNLMDVENSLAELLSDEEHLQRRFDDYSENPGPMFGR